MPVINPNNGEICVVPGDIIKLVWEIPSADDPQAQAAIKAIKQALANDRRLNYQGSDFGLETVTYNDMGVDSTAQIFCFRAYVEIAKNDKPEAGYITIGVDPATQKTVWLGEGPDLNAGTVATAKSALADAWNGVFGGSSSSAAGMAGIGGVGTGKAFAYSLAAIVVAIAASYISYNSRCKVQTACTTINEIALADIPDAIKKQAIDAITTGTTSSRGVQVGKSVANISQAAIVLAVVIGGFLLLQAMPKRGAQAAVIGAAA